MPSITDLIAKTEEDAENIRKEARAEAKLTVEKAQRDAQNDIQQAQNDVKKELLLRRENAAHTGEKLAEDIKEMRKAESLSNCKEAEKHIDKAVKYIIERISV